MILLAYVKPGYAAWYQRDTGKGSAIADGEMVFAEGDKFVGRHRTRAVHSGILVSIPTTFLNFDLTLHDTLDL